MTVDTHKHLLMAANDAIARGDADGFLEHCTDDTLWTFVGDRTLRGKGEVRQWMESTYIQPPQNTVDRMIAEGDSLVAIGTITTTDGSIEVTSQYCDVWTVREGKLAAVQAFVL
jgi:uncharacterized protein (TIGR02246 family)